MTDLIFSFFPPSTQPVRVHKYMNDERGKESTMLTFFFLLSSRNKALRLSFPRSRHYMPARCLITVFSV